MSLDGRSRKSTPKGHEYALEIKFKALGEAWRSVKSTSDEMKSSIALNPTLDDAKCIYAKWMDSYENFLTANDEYCALLDEYLRAEHLKQWLEEKDIWISNLKSTIENWFSSRSNELRATSNYKSKSNKTSIGSKNSKISSRRLQEEKNTAELEARQKLLMEKQELEMKLKMSEMKFQHLAQSNELQTQIEVSKAKSQVLEEVEGEEDDSQCLDADSVEEERMQQPVMYNTIPIVVDSMPASPKVCKSSDQKQEKKLCDVLVEIQKPKLEIKKFGGDCLGFNKFMRQFKSKIEGLCQNDERIAYLEQYTTGEAHKIVNGFSYLDANVGYPAAIKELTRRYGDPEVIANSYVKKVMSWIPIRANDPKALDEFSVFLIECKAATHCVGSLGVLEFSENLKHIMQKLPFHMHDRWRNIVQKNRKQTKRTGFSDMVDFVQLEAVKLNDPIYGKENLTSRETTEPKRSNRIHTSFSTQVPDTNKDTRPKLVCPHCQEQHWLSRCPSFKAKSVEGRKKFVRERKLCMNCLTAGHFVSSCPKPSFCKLCPEKHSSFLHPVSQPRRNQLHAMQSDSTDRNTSISCNQQIPAAGEPTSLAVERSGKRISMAVVPVQVRAEGSRNVISTYAFLDNGSNVTFCTEALAQKLGAKGKSIGLNLTTMGGQSTSKSRSISLEVSNLDCSIKVKLPRVYTRQCIPVSTNMIASQRDVDMWPHLQGTNIPSIEAEIEILIGSDVPEVHQPLEVKTSEDGGPYATRTILGWVVNGPLSPSNQRSVSSFASISIPTIDEPPLEKQFKDYCNLEFNDVKDDSTSMSREDMKALDIMDNSVQLKDGHYEVAMPWKNDPTTLPNNKSVALKRLDGIKTRLQKDNVTHQKYTEFMEGLVTKGYARKVTESNHQPKWYLPHHPVVHPQKPGKVRVVFDCSSKFKGVSLNEFLLQGPDLTNSLIGVLMRFRQGSVAFSADIEQMFYQIRVAEADTQYLTFLWWEGGDLNSEVAEYQMLVHLFGGRSSPSCSNFGLRRTATDNACDFPPTVIESVLRNFYVDDLLKSMNDEEEAISTALQLKNLLRKGGFNLTKWTSTSTKLVKALGETDPFKPTSISLGGDNEPIQRVLGVRWLISDDSLGYSISLKKKPNTRRGILSLVSSVYDPLGLVSPFILQAKLLLRELCVLGRGWDDNIPRDVELKWQEWLSDLDHLKKLKISRCYTPSNFGAVVQRELHHFGDASSAGYGAASYVLLKDERGNVCSTLVAAKSRLAPVKTQTIPRLELQVAVLTTRLDKMIRKELKEINIDRSLCWTDSTCVLRYLKNEHTRFKTFVSNRVTSILTQTNQGQWRHVPSQLNPADLASRGMSAAEIIASDFWYSGPEFLLKNETEWPQMPSELVIDKRDHEVKVVTAAVVAEINDTLDELILHFSSWTKLTRVTAWILRFKNNLKRISEKNRTTGKNKTSSKNVAPLSVSELKEAEMTLVRRTQRNNFPEEFRLLEADKPVKSASSLLKLDPQLKDGVLKVGGRLRRAAVSEELKHQIILPKSSHLSLLILRYYHKVTGHSGVNHVLAEVRRRFWPVGGRTLVPGRFVAEDCYVRKRWRKTQYLADVFWRRWLQEYLPALQERQKWCKAQQNAENGDIVLVHEPSSPRSSWPLARVIEVFRNGSDGMVRSVKLKTSTGILVRPVNKIVRLEVTGCN